MLLVAAVRSLCGRACAPWRCGRSARGRRPRAAGASVAAPAPAPVTRRRAEPPRGAARAGADAGPRGSAPGHGGAARPGDVPPEPEVANAPPQQNDAIEPEQPQTARWKLEKTEHITALLGRDVERLEREREEAESRGDKAPRRTGGHAAPAHRVRLDELREEARTLAEAARNEPPEP